MRLLALSSILLLGAAGVSPAYAVDPQTFTVDGLRLGSTLEEAKSTIKQREPDLEIHVAYGKNSVGHTWPAALVAEGPGYKNPNVDGRIIFVFFTETTGQAFEIQRQSEYPIGHEPTMETVSDTVYKNYGAKFEPNLMNLQLQFLPSGQPTSWTGDCFQGTGFDYPASVNTLSLLHRQSSEGLNRSTHPVDGCGISLRIEALQLPYHSTIVGGIIQELLDQQRQVDDIKKIQAAKNNEDKASETKMQQAHSNNDAGL